MAIGAIGSFLGKLDGWIGAGLKGLADPAVWAGAGKRAMIGAGIGAAVGGAAEGSQGGSFISGAVRGGMAGAAIGGGSKVAQNFFKGGATDAFKAAASKGSTPKVLSKDTWKAMDKSVIGSHAATGAFFGGVVGGIKSAGEGEDFMSGALTGAVAGAALGGAIGYGKSYRGYAGKLDAQKTMFDPVNGKQMSWNTDSRKYTKSQWKNNSSILRASKSKQLQAMETSANAAKVAEGVIDGQMSIYTKAGPLRKKYQ